MSIKKRQQYVKHAGSLMLTFRTAAEHAKKFAYRDDLTDDDRRELAWFMIYLSDLSYNVLESMAIAVDLMKESDIDARGVGPIKDNLQEHGGKAVEPSSFTLP